MALEVARSWDRKAKISCCIYTYFLKPFFVYKPFFFFQQGRGSERIKSQHGRAGLAFRMLCLGKQRQELNPWGRQLAVKGCGGWSPAPWTLGTCSGQLRPLCSCNLAGAECVGRKMSPKGANSFPAEV